MSFAQFLARHYPQMESNPEGTQGSPAHSKLDGAAASFNDGSTCSER